MTLELPGQRRPRLPPSWGDMLLAAVFGAAVAMVVLALMGRLSW